MLFFDGSGFCLFYKRLDKGTFTVPAPLRDGDQTVTLDEPALEDLLDGIDVGSATPMRRRAARH